MRDDVVTYRLPGAVFPIRFEMLGQDWELRTFAVHGGGYWAAMFEGNGRWQITSAPNQERLESVLREAGVEILRRTFTATLFLRLSQLKIAVRVEASGGGS